MTLEYTATDINSVYESLKRKLSLFDAVNHSASASLNHCANLFAQSATIHQNQPLVSPSTPFPCVMYGNAVSGLIFYSQAGRQYGLGSLSVTVHNHMAREVF